MESPKSTGFGIEMEGDEDSLTVTLQVAVSPPSFVVTVMIAEPEATPVTVPMEETVAIDSSLLDQDTLLFVAFSGRIEATIVDDSPTNNSSSVLLKETLETCVAEEP